MRTAAENHRRVAGAFTERVRGVSDPAGWDALAPVAGWTARDVVGHLVEWFPAFLAGGSDIRLSSGPALHDDPVGAWTAQCDAVQAVLDDSSSQAVTFFNRHIGEMPLPDAIDRFYTADVFMHTWDLARATGQDDTLDPEYCAELLEGMIPYENAMRSSGQYGPRVPVPDDAPVQDRMLGFIGRDPLWRPG
jgi:uncharacterized protein (TIGR03086 family)